ncbi:MAG: hypothetical protein HYZ40_02820 [Rhodospirillales bacterium]|nr:hypothetical protein [Rhodospirillales bacterium]
MDRGLVAPLSPNEEITLRRVAYGVVKAKRLQLAHLTRLKSLALIEDRNGVLNVTPMGRQRLTNSPVARLDKAPIAVDSSVAALAKALKVTKL